MGLHDTLSPCARTLKDLDLTVSLSSVPQAIGGLYEKLEAMAGHNILEVVICEVLADGGDETGFIRIYNPKSGKGAGQTWVVGVTTGFLRSLNRRFEARQGRVD